MDPIGRRQDTGAAAAMVTLAALVAVSEWLNGIVEEREHAERVIPALAGAEASARRHWAENPHDGVLLLVRYRQSFHPDTPVTGPRRFGWVDVGYGNTREEAAIDILGQASISQGLGAHERWSDRTIWLPPPTPSAPSQFRTPWPRSAPVRPAGGGSTLALQDVKWDVDGFDDEGRSAARFSSPADATVSALRPPRRIGREDIPVVTRPVGGGGTLEAIDLDPVMPGDVTGIPVFPATPAAQQTLDNTRGIRTDVTLPPADNVSMVRFARPEDVELAADRPV